MDKKQGVAAMLSNNLVGIEVFFLILFGQLGQLIASGKPISIRLVIGNIFLNIVIATVVFQIGIWRDWDQPLILILGGVIGVLGVNASIALFKKLVTKV